MEQVEGGDKGKIGPQAMFEQHKHMFTHAHNPIIPIMLVRIEVYSC